ncbi:MAG: ROK family protein [Bacteroidales bacterium]|nr:ROK family protein [Bacteroidales bacterium]
MDYKNDSRIVLGLDAGGTNLDFFAIKGGELITEGIRYPAAADKLEDILQRIVQGFEEVLDKAGGKAAAISFCFPGPADYENGIIGDLENMPLFRGGVPLKSMLEDHFGIPVYINNDGDLFTYGEALAGLLPEVNAKLQLSGNPKRYHNLLGVTFGTGFGGGMVLNGELFRGDNSAGFEINRMRNKLYPETSAEDSVTIRAIKRVYAREANIHAAKIPEPDEIYKIATGHTKGNIHAAKTAFDELAEVAGDTLANAVTLTDSLIVIGGGLSGAAAVFMPKLVEEMNTAFTGLNGDKLSRLEIEAFNLEDEKGFAGFGKNTSTRVSVPFSDREVGYDPVKKIGVGLSRLGTSHAVAIGAYTYALNELS